MAGAGAIINRAVVSTFENLAGAEDVFFNTVPLKIEESCATVADI